MEQVFDKIEVRLLGCEVENARAGLLREASAVIGKRSAAYVTCTTTEERDGPDKGLFSVRVWVTVPGPMLTNVSADSSRTGVLAPTREGEVVTVRNMGERPLEVIGGPSFEPIAVPAGNSLTITNTIRKMEEKAAADDARIRRIVDESLARYFVPRMRSPVPQPIEQAEPGNGEA